MIQRWPVRKARKTLQKLSPDTPLITGQRVIDTLFPIAKGGTAAIPGAFGTGKTVVEHEIAKWSDADVIVYVGCGERGNEMSEVLTTFPELKDPKTGKSLMERTVLIANTSNMPVIAREASIYTGVTIAEYYRDMGYSVALLADSTSRWAEALREISGRLEEMPGEEGYPSYLSKRIAEFYERAGTVKTLGGKIGSLSIIGAVSPPGGDISEPVSQSTLRSTRVFWSLDAHLANSRHFPSINWLNSYSLYTPLLDEWYKKNLPADWVTIREETNIILQKEAEINELVQLVGYDALSEADKLIVKAGKIIREDYLQQNAFDEVDTYCSLNKQYKMLKTVIELYDKEKDLISKGMHVNQLKDDRAVDKVARMKYVKESEIDRYFIETMKIVNTIGEEL
jgi:V/A-type H+-transporting ATPase subunit A